MGDDRLNSFNIYAHLHDVLDWPRVKKEGRVAAQCFYNDGQRMSYSVTAHVEPDERIDAAGEAVYC